MLNNMENVTLSVSDWGSVKQPKTGQNETIKKYTWINHKNRVKIEVRHLIIILL